MLQLTQNESTAARRRLPVYLVDDTDGKTPETGITFSAGEIKISKNGASEGNHAGTVTELAGGLYYYEASAGEVDTLGFLSARFTKTGVRTFVAVAQVQALDLYTAGGGVTAPTAAQVADAVWDELVAGHAIAGSTGEALAGASTGGAPTATEIADEILTRDWTAVSGEAARSVLNALRFLRNKWSVTGGTLTVTEEDDTTTAWTASLTATTGAAPVTGVDPA